MANSFVASLTQTCSVKLVPASFSRSDDHDLCIPPGVTVDRAVLAYVSMSPSSVSPLLLPPPPRECLGALTREMLNIQVQTFTVDHCA